MPTTQVDRQDILERRELAKKMAMQRTKVVNRKKLTDGKDGASAQRMTTRGGNMLNFTGDEANGLQMSPGSVSMMAVFFIFACVCLHLLGPKYIPKVIV